MVPESDVESLATDLQLSPEDVRSIMHITTKQDSIGAIRRLADLHSWTFNEAKSYVDRVRRRLVELGYLDDVRILQEIQYGPVQPYLHADGHILSSKVVGDGQASEQASVRLDVAPFTFVYPAGAPNYSKVKEALLTGGKLKVWSRPGDGLSANSTLHIRQLEKDGQVLVWYADTAPYYDQR
jgi:hypothetical protein